MIYKLKYQDKEEAITDLKAKGVLVDVTFMEETTLAYGPGVRAVVELGLIMLTPPIRDGLEIITEPVFAEGYHFDVMSDQAYDFGANLIEPKNPKHVFAGIDQPKDFTYQPNILRDQNDSGDTPQ